ncbi:MAG: hypothetical protein ACI9G1_000159 [Pirellulaceae bacterium]
MLNREILEPRIVLAAAVLISEIMADNQTTKQDGWGQYSDWIELYNSGNTAVDLDGWFLTDEATDPQRWTFPATTIAAGDHVLLFASGANALDPGNYLHTNFRLNAAGETLTLFESDGSTVVSQIAFPQQLPDIAYGVEQSPTFPVFVAEGDSGKVLIPDSNDDLAIGTTWISASFDDSTWDPITADVGYDTSPIVITRSNVALGKTALQSTNGFGFPSNNTVDGDRNTIGHTATGDINPWWDVDLGDEFLIDQVDVHTRNNCCTPGSPERDYNLRVEIRDDGGNIVYTSSVFNPWDGTGGSATVVGVGASFSVDLTGEPGGGVDGNFVRVTKESHGGTNHSEWLHLGEVEVFANAPADSPNLAIGRPTSADASTPDPTLAIDQNIGTITHSQNVGPVFWQLDLEAEQHVGRIELINRGDGCCPERLNGATLTVLDGSMNPLFTSVPISGAGVGESLEFDLDGAGFVDARFIRVDHANQYLSIAELRVFPPDPYTFDITSNLEAEMQDVNSSAYLRFPFDVSDVDSIDQLQLDLRYDDGFVAYINGTEVARVNAPNGTPDYDAAATANHYGPPEMFAVSTSTLRTGANVLAIHGLNESASDTDFFLAPQLSGRAVASGSLGYLIVPTPDAVNGLIVAGFVADTTFDVDRGFFDTAFDVNITTRTNGATIIYTLDGSAPSESNGIQIPAAAIDVPPVATLSIASTTTLRAIAVFAGFEPSNVDTQTYIFVQDVLTQPANPAGLPAVWDGLAQNPINADYEVDPEIVNDAAYAQDLVDGLTELPSISLVMDPDHLFGNDDGIYINSGQRGSDWEHPTSVEILQPDGSNFQADSGVRIHGFSWRFHSNTPKHSFRLEFSDEYGPQKLEYPLFPDAPVDKFDSIVLRAQGGRAWAGFQNPDQSQYIRDAFARDTARDMGKVDGHAAFYHLYLNGLYWGLYHAVERPDAQMGEEYFGGNDEEYDALNRRTVTNEAIDGDLQRYNEMQALADQDLSTAENYALMQQYVDVDNLIDFFLIHQYTTNRDGPEIFSSNNQRAIGHRSDSPEFKFFVWDMEYSMWDAMDNINIDVDVATSASHVYTALRANAEFRLLYADRAHMHLFNDGALTPTEAAARWETRATEIFKPIVAESARWGDSRRATPYTRDVEWQAERNRLLTSYFPVRTGVLVNQLRVANLYPATSAPVFNQHGGRVATGFQLSMTAAAPTIYYTLDGSDPRLEGGGIHPNAVLYAGQFPLSASGIVRTRALDNGDWSALNEAAFQINVLATAANFAITEVNYHPLDPTVDEAAVDPTWTDNDFEYIEFQNTSGETVDLANVHFDSGLTFNFNDATVSSIAPGQFIIVARNPAALTQRYGTLPIVGEFTSGGLSNNSELLHLVDSFDATISLFDYDDNNGWPNRPDGDGSTLELISTAIDESNSESWRSSSEYNGSPGYAGIGPFQDVVVNEVLSHTDAPQVDAIELYNTTDQPVDISGWWLSDASPAHRKFVVPDTTILAPFDYIVFYESDFNPTMGANESDFALDSAHGDDVWLIATDPQGKPTLFADHVEFGAQLNGESWGRWPNGNGVFHPLSPLTLDNENTGPRVGPLIISELMYNAPAPDGLGGVDDEDLEFVEIFNSTNQAVDLTGWQIDGGIGFIFPAQQMLGAGAVLVVVPFDPLDPNNATRVADFLSYYDVPATIDMVGGFSSRLDNGGDRVQLLRPDDPPIDEPNFIPLLLEDEVSYDDQAPWPTGADNGGASLARTTLTLPTSDDWGLDPTNWATDKPSPGLLINSPPVIVGVEINSLQSDTPDLAKGPQPTNWRQQRSDLRSLVVTFSEPVALSAGHITLKNIGLNGPVDPDVEFALTQDHIQITATSLTLQWNHHELSQGVYDLLLDSGILDGSGQPLDGNDDGTAGDSYRLQGSVDNGFYKLHAEFNGDRGVSVFDFTTFSYWFGTSVAENGAPAYADLSGDNGVSVFDFTTFSSNFGKGVVFDTAFAVAIGNTPNRFQRPEFDGPELVDLDSHDESLMRLLAEWNWWT